MRNPQKYSTEGKRGRVMRTDKICCNCKWYEGVHDCPGTAPCKRKNKMVLWKESCDGFCLVPKGFAYGALTNADRIRSMTDEELAEWIFNTLWSYDAICGKRKKDWLEWLKQEATVDNAACSANETSEKVKDGE